MLRALLHFHNAAVKQCDEQVQKKDHRDEEIQSPEEGNEEGHQDISVIVLVGPTQIVMHCDCRVVIVNPIFSK